MRNQAFLWDAKVGIRGLGVLEGDRASFASGVARDGRRISGYSVGDDRVRACVWDRDGDGWKATALPHASRLGSNTVAISGDGRYVAAVDGVSPCLWTRGASGEWSREVIGDAGSLVPRAVNDSGTVVGVQSTGDGLTHAVIWSREAGTRRLEKPEGYVKSEAFAVNNAGTVVGLVDGPAGSEVGPNAFVFEDGRLRLLAEGGPSFAYATAINDQRAGGRRDGGARGIDRVRARAASLRRGARRAAFRWSADRSADPARLRPSGTSVTKVSANRLAIGERRGRS